MRRAPGLACATLVVLACAFAAPASAQPRPTRGTKTAESATGGDVDAAEQLYAKLEYEQANALATRIVQRRGLAHAELVRASRVLAVTYAILDKQEASRDAFVKLLVYEPDYAADPNLGPKVSVPFGEAKTIVRAYATKPGLDVNATVKTDGGQLRVTTRDPTKIVRKVTVGYRWTSTGEYTVTTLGTGEGNAVDVAPAPAERTRVDFYAQALDERDAVVFEAGSPQAPKSAFADAAESPSGGAPIAKEGGSSFVGSPLFWVLTGAAVVGGGTALFFATRGDDAPTSARLSPIMLCGSAERCR